MKKIIELKDVSKNYGEEVVLKGSTFDVFEGEVLVIMGPSGVGKSTLLNLIAQIETVDSGLISYDASLFLGVKVPFPFAFQSAGALLPWLTVRENLMLVNENASKEDVNDLLDVLALSSHQDKKPAVLSGGMKQRLSIGRALMCKAKVLILDEAFSGLDEKLKDSIQTFVLEAKRHYGLTLMMVTHDKEEARKMGTRVIDINGNPIDL